MEPIRYGLLLLAFILAAAAVFVPEAWTHRLNSGAILSLVLYICLTLGGK